MYCYRKITKNQIKFKISKSKIVGKPCKIYEPICMPINKTQIEENLLNPYIVSVELHVRENTTGKLIIIPAPSDAEEESKTRYKGKLEPEEMIGGDGRKTKEETETELEYFAKEQMTLLDVLNKFLVVKWNKPIYITVHLLLTEMVCYELLNDIELYHDCFYTRGLKVLEPYVPLILQFEPSCFYTMFSKPMWDATFKQYGVVPYYANLYPIKLKQSKN